MKSSFLVLISGEPSFTEGLKNVLSQISPEFVIDTAGSGKKVLFAASKKDYSVIISIFALQDINGTELFSKIRKNCLDIPFILVFDKGEENEVLEALNCETGFYIQPTFATLKKNECS